MAKYKRSSFLTTISKLISVIPLFLNFWHDAAALLGEEAQQAKKNVKLLAIFLTLLIVLLLSSWISLLALLFLYLVSLNLSWLLSMLLVFCFNLLLLLIIVLFIWKVSKTGFFPETRRFLLPYKK